MPKQRHVEVIDLETVARLGNDWCSVTCWTPMLQAAAGLYHGRTGSRNKSNRSGSTPSLHYPLLVLKAIPQAHKKATGLAGKHHYESFGHQVCNSRTC